MRVFPSQRKTAFGNACRHLRSPSCHGFCGQRRCSGRRKDRRIPATQYYWPQSASVCLYTVLDERSVRRKGRSESERSVCAFGHPRRRRQVRKQTATRKIGMFSRASQETPNGRVDAAARFHSSIAGPIMMRNTLPPLASNDLLCVASNTDLTADHRAGETKRFRRCQLAIANAVTRINLTRRR